MYVQNFGNMIISMNYLGIAIYLLISWQSCAAQNVPDHCFTIGTGLAEASYCFNLSQPLFYYEEAEHYCWGKDPGYHLATFQSLQNFNEVMNKYIETQVDQVQPLWISGKTNYRLKGNFLNWAGCQLWTHPSLKDPKDGAAETELGSPVHRHGLCLEAVVWNTTGSGSANVTMEMDYCETPKAAVCMKLLNNAENQLCQAADHAIFHPVCNMTLDVGVSCPGHNSRMEIAFGYQITEEGGRCVGMTYNGCGGNLNRFLFRDACQKTCGDTSPDFKLKEDTNIKCPPDYFGYSGLCYNTPSKQSLTAAMLEPENRDTLCAKGTYLPFFENQSQMTVYANLLKTKHPSITSVFLDLRLKTIRSAETGQVLSFAIFGPTYTEMLTNYLVDVDTHRLAALGLPDEAMCFYLDVEKQIATGYFCTDTEKETAAGLAVGCLADPIFDEVTRYQLVQDLKKDLLANYSRNVRPLGNNNNGALNIYGAWVVHHVEVDEVRQQITVHGIVFCIWEDITLTWSATDGKYDGITEIMINPRKIWTPRLRVMESLGRYSTSNIRPARFNHAIVKPRGHVRLVYSMSVTVGCRFDVSAYPYDYHQCMLQIIDGELFPQIEPRPSLWPGFIPPNYNYTHEHSNDKLSGWIIADASLAYTKDLTTEMYDMLKNQADGTKQAGKIIILLVRNMNTVALSILIPYTIVVCNVLAVIWLTSLELTVVLAMFSVVFQAIVLQDLIVMLPLSIGKTPRIIYLHGFNLFATCAVFIVLLVQHKSHNSCFSDLYCFIRSFVGEKLLRRVKFNTPKLTKESNRASQSWNHGLARINGAEEGHSDTKLGGQMELLRSGDRVVRQKCQQWWSDNRINWRLGLTLSLIGCYGVLEVVVYSGEG